jgi:tetratricopeptide (TPR) repeat protein
VQSQFAIQNFLNSQFPKIRKERSMKKILVMVVLGVAALASARSATPLAQGQPANPPTSSVDPATGSVNPPTGSVNPPTGQAAQTAPAASPSAAPVIKDPAEYNAYVGAVQQKDPAAQISGLEAFVTQYPNSVMKNQALEILMGAYQGTGNQQKTIDTASKLVQADPNNVRALTLLAYFDRMKAQGGDPNAKQLLGDAKKYAQQGLDALPKFTKPDGTSDADFNKMKDQMTGIFDSAIGLSDLTDASTATAPDDKKKDYDDAIKNLKVAADGNPTDFSIVYPLALAYLTPPDPKTPLDPANAVNGIWYAARASAVAPPQAQAQIEKYARSQYRRYHGGEDGWTDVLAQAKASPAQPAGFTIKPAPSPADQAHAMLTTTPEKMDFATWEFILSNGSQADQDTVWNAIKGKAVQMNGTVISTTPTEFQIAGSSDDIDAKKADITLKFEDAVPVKLIPKDAASFDFQGEPASYTPNPFMMVMEKGKLLKAAAPAKKIPPAHHKPAAQ